MRNRHLMFAQIASDNAAKSSFKQKMGAVVVYKDKVVGSGFNFAHGTGKPHTDGQHAEIVALNNTTARFRAGSTVYVTRNTGDNLRLAKPCKPCQKVMRKMGVKYVWYSCNKGEWHRMEL